MDYFDHLTCKEKVSILSTQLKGLSMLFVTEKISKNFFFSETLRTHPYTKYTMYYCLYSIQIDEKCAF